MDSRSKLSMRPRRQTNVIATRQVDVIATQHLDVAYLWKRDPDGEALMRQCFERAIEMIEAYPEIPFVFSRSTAWSFQIVERKYPDLFAKVRRYVDLDKIELCGGQWVEPDNIIPDGETLVRQCLYGQSYFAERFGKTATVGWNPDAFAHGHTLPQILAKSGLEGYYFHRCQPRDQTNHEISQFVWEGLDGTRILVFAGNWRGKPDREVLEACSAEMERTGLPMGFVVTGANSDRRVTMAVDWVPLLAQAEGYANLPGARWASAGEVAKAMTSYAERLPVVGGELEFRFTGTYTTEGSIKRYNRRMESLLAEAEKWGSCAMLLNASSEADDVGRSSLGRSSPGGSGPGGKGYEYPKALITEAWRDLCVNNFHDIICGTCYQYVHEEALELFREIEARGRTARDAALRFLAARTGVEDQVDGGRPLLVFNALSWPRRSPVLLPLAKATDQVLVSPDGEVVACQPVTMKDGSRGLIFVPPDVAAMACSLFYLQDVSAAAEPGLSAPGFGAPRRGEPRCGEPRCEERYWLENEFLRAEVDPETGELDRLFDKVNQSEVLAAETKGNRLRFYEDKSELSNFEPWLIGYTGRVLDAGRVVQVERVEWGPVRSCIRVVRTAPLSDRLPNTEIIQEIILYDDLPYLVFETWGDWQADGVLLKAEFDLGTTCDRIACEMPYGVAEREVDRRREGTGKGDPSEVGRDSAIEDGLRAGTTVEEPDRPMQRWLDHGGVAFLNNGKYGYDASSNQVRISLMRAPRHRDGELVGLGPFSFSYAVMPHSGDWREAGLVQRGYEFNNDLRPVFANPHPGLPLAGRSFCGIRDPDVLITAMKLAEDNEGLVLRLYESQGERKTTELEVMADVESASECDLLEMPIFAGDGAISDGAISDGAISDGCEQVSERTIRVRLEPFEIKTIRLELVGGLGAVR